MFAKNRMSKKPFLAEIWPKTAIFAGPGNFFSANFIFFEKFFFAQFSKLSHFEHKNAKKKFFSQIPLYSDPGFYLRKIFRIFLIFSNKLFFRKSVSAIILIYFSLIRCKKSEKWYVGRYHNLKTSIFGPKMAIFGHNSRTKILPDLRFSPKDSTL